VEDIGLDLAD